MTSGQCFFNIDHTQCFFSQQALCLCLFHERQEQSFPAAFCPVAPYCRVWVPPCHRLQITSYRTVSGRITNTHTLCHQNFKIPPGLIWSHQPAVHHQRACLRGGRVLWGCVLTSCFGMTSVLMLWRLSLGLQIYPDTHLQEKKIAPHFIQSSAAFFGSLQASSGEACHLQVCDHHRAERAHRATAQAALCWAHFHASLAANLLNPPFHNLSASEMPAVGCVYRILCDGCN